VQPQSRLCSTAHAQPSTGRQYTLAALSPLLPYAGGLYRGFLLDEAIRRYECVWLPFIAKNGGTTSGILPPLDVAYIWHVHRLEPSYTGFCKQAFGHALVVAQPFQFTTAKNPALKSALWKRNERFYPPKITPRKLTQDWSDRHRLKVDERIRPDLRAAVQRQANFGHMFLRLCYQDRSYMEQVCPAVPPQSVTRDVYMSTKVSEGSCPATPATHTRPSCP
jgi:hypothetical protein